jgi:signal transduction histidine kinase
MAAESEKSMITVGAQQTVLLVSDDGYLCAAARRDLAIRRPEVRVSAVSNVDAALQIIEEAAPGAILLVEESPEVSADAGLEAEAEKSQLELALKLLCVYAPVVVLGRTAHGPRLSAMIAAGVADYIPRAENSMTEALGLLERRLLQARGIAGSVPGSGEEWSRDFAEVLRHELNNPLTGILGNAELLLAEINRIHDGRLPHGGQERVETIAALAMRMRETVRQLSQQWEARRDPGRSISGN